jgi:serine/threonine-protein kinase RsbT
VPEEVCVAINSDLDIVAARQKGREMGEKIGFPSTDLTLIATAISELARNIVLYAGRGEILIKSLENATDSHGIMVVARDEGPGIPNVRHALQDGFSTSGGLGLGLPGAKRLMDELVIHSTAGQGTTVTAKKWLK